MTFIAGADPGVKTGYLCVLQTDPLLPTFSPIPVDRHGDVDVLAVVGIAQTFRSLGVALVVVEKQQAFPGTGPKCPVCHKHKKMQGLVSTSELVGCYEILRTAFIGAGLRVITPRSGEWKGVMGLSDDKKISIAKFEQLLPGVDMRPLERNPRSRAPDHNRCESGLLCFYGKRILTQEGTKT